MTKSWKGIPALRLMLSTNSWQLFALVTLAANHFYLPLFCQAELATLKSNDANSKLRHIRQASGLESSHGLEYPDYCWFTGLENRILLEYPLLKNLLAEHSAQLHIMRNLGAASQLHREIFKHIYSIELERLNGLLPKSDHNHQSSEPSNLGRKPLHNQAAFRAAYKLFDLWANTPGDFEARRDDYENYLETYLMQAHIEFWSYCFDQPNDCRDILSQLIVLAENQELGQIELLQISINIITLMNSHKADLVLEKLTDRNIIKLDDLAESNQAVCKSMARVKATINSSSNGSYTISESDRRHAKMVDGSNIRSSAVNNNLEDLMSWQEHAYELGIAKIVELIETDDDFNEAAFHYVFTANSQVHEIIDPKIETYFADRISKARALGCI